MVYATRNHHKRATASSLERLPPDIMTNVLGFVDLSVRVRLASCSTILQQLVLKDCRELWIHIDFSDLTYSQRQRFTDEMLASLLTRVDARHVTENLTLNYFDKIRGRGLAPLRYSRVLEYIDMRGCNNQNEDDLAATLRILQTMIHHKLFEVKFSLGQIRISSVCKRFRCDLRAAKLKQAHDQNVLCSECQHPVSDPSRQLATRETSFPSIRCPGCKSHFCGASSCSVSISDCTMCGDASCDKCDLVGRCCECNKSFCGRCSHLENCDTCGEAYCSDCRSFIMCFCCGELRCERCDNDNFWPCIRCHEWFCRECRNVNFCVICEGLFCEECFEVEHCDLCNGTFCIDCREVVFLGCCEEMVCTGCFQAQQCDACFGNFCTLEKCGTCKKSFCDKCRDLQHCGVCHESFCNDDCAFVDHCEQCKTCLCDGCEVVLRCAWCGKASCEDCRRTEAFCLMCSEQSHDVEEEISDKEASDEDDDASL